MSTDRKAWSALAACAALLIVAAAPPLASGYHADDPEYDYTFGWDTWSADVQSVEGETAENETTRVPVEGNRANLTSLRFHLAWSDDVGDPDTLEMTVTAPDGSRHGPVSGNESEGNLTIDVAFGPMPEGETVVRAHSQSEAWSAFHDRHPPRRQGVGTWTVNVTLKEAGDGDVVLLDQKDESQTWTLTVSADGYRGVFLEKQLVPDPSPDPSPGNETGENPDAGNETGTDPNPGNETGTDPNPGNETGENPDDGGENTTGAEDEIPDEVSYDPPSEGAGLSGTGARAAIVIGGAALGVIAAIALARLKS